jgi:hypothetical protein
MRPALAEIAEVRGRRPRKVSELLRRGLLAEAPAAKTALAWRLDADGSGVTLTVTDTGVAALEPRVAPEPRPIASAGSKIQLGCY